MKQPNPLHALLLVSLAALLAGGCATRPPASATTSPAPQSVLRAVAIDRSLEDRILALDPERISEQDVAATLSKAPAPHMVLIHGGIFPTHMIMRSAGRFFVAMGYPEDRIRNPGDRSWSHSPYDSSLQIAGEIAWYYEREGVRPMMIGHSQGGIQAIKVLYDLAGHNDKSLVVWDPNTDVALDRTTIVDPLTGVTRPVVGITLPYVSVVAAGGAALMLPNQWSMANRVHTIPDSVEDFTGFSVGMDFWAWTLPGVNATNEFRHNGTAQVRSISLPAVYNHLTVPIVGPLADDKEVRDWIDAYVPNVTTSDPPPQTVGYGVLWVANVWHDIKKHWALEAQRLIRARRAALGTP